MSAKRKPTRRGRSPGRQPARDASPRGAESARPPRTTLKVRRVRGSNEWELVHPPCAIERADDVAEVRAMLEAGETEVAIDELRWLLSGCSDLVDAHAFLGEIALADGDFALARGHFGYAFQLGRAAFPAGGLPGPLPYGREANQAFLESAKALAWCLIQLGKHDLAREVLDDLLRCDPTDPLGAAAMRGLLPAAESPRSE